MSERAVPRVWQYATTTAWAILPEKLPGIFEIAARENLDLEAVAAKLGRQLDNSRATTVRDGVAIIPIEGVIFPRASLFAAISGGVAADDLAADLHQALADAAIHSIALLVDSPGGDVNGVAEVASMIFDARAQKPIAAYVRDLGASAAYWLAAAAGEVVVASTALVGSIGIVGTVADPTKQTSRSIEFVSSQSPHKRPDPTTERGGARIQARVDELASIFIADVARFRGVSPETVAADFGQGDLLVGQAAVDAGLADRVGSFEGVIAGLQQEARNPRRTMTGGHMAGQGNQGFWAKVFGLMGEQMDAEAAFTPAVLAASGPEPVALTTLTAAPDAAMSDEIARLRTEVARLQANEALAVSARLSAEATAFAERLIVAGRALPVEQDHLAALYRQLAADDAAHGAIVAADGTSTTRVATLSAWQDARPTSALLGDAVPVGRPGLTLVANQETTQFGEPERGPLTAEEEERVLSLTESGRAALAARRAQRQA